MQLNALAAAFHHLKKHLRFSLFNIVGLTIAFIAFFFISIFVSHELNYDNYNVHRDDIYRVESRLRLGANVTDYAIAPPVIGATIGSKIPSIISVCRVFAERNLKFEFRNELITEDKVAYADPSIFQVFTLPLLQDQGAPQLNTPNTIVLSEFAALKYFNRTDIVGEPLRMLENDSVRLLTVAAVMKNIPRQSHFHFDFLLPMASLPIHSNSNFLSFYPVSTYILVTPKSDIRRLDATINAWVRSSIPDYDEIEKGGNEISMLLTPLKNIHLQSDKKYELSKNGKQQYIYIFSVGALFILIMAAINFMNLSLAKFDKRSREAALKKILGSSAGNLTLQIIFESLLLCSFSIVIALVAGWGLINFFNNITGQSITFSDVQHSPIIPLMLITAIILGLVSGIYPALLFSSFRPTAIISGRSFGMNRHSSFSLRHVLLVVQFVVSTFLITSTIIIYRQLSFIHRTSTGYDKEELFVIRNASAVDNPLLLKEKIETVSGVTSASLSNFLPTNDTRWSNFGGTQTSESPVQTEFWAVDEDYISTLGIGMLKGRNFDKSRVTDSSAVILNETAYRMFGNNDKLFNDEISFSYHQQPKSYHVIGVVKNFHFNSFRQSIGPLVFVLAEEKSSNLVIKYRQNTGVDFHRHIQDVWQSMQPREKMNFSYMDDDFNILYKDDDLMGTLFTIFAALSILIAGMGLFSFISNSINMRKKEITIRSILGATKRSVAILVSGSYLWLVMMSVAIALPFARFAMAHWLEGYVYRYQIRFTDYLLGGVISIVIAVVTLSSKAFTFNTKRLISNIKAN